ncbi:MAG: hypothetical protein ACR2OV_13165 [Hyphomicrobiaceae bacterium]
MTETFDAAAVANVLVEARRSRSPVDAAGFGCDPATLEDAYAVHTAVMQKIGTVGAFKTGIASDGRQVMAPIATSGLRASETSFAPDELWLAGVELEVAFRLERPLPDRTAPDFAERLRDAVIAVPAIEVVDTRLAFHESCSEWTKLADNQFNAGLVVGEPVHDWHGLDLSTPAHTLQVGAATIADGPGHINGGSAWDLLRGFVEIVGDHCGGLQVGQYVTTGALSGLHWIDKGQPVVGRVEGLGEVSVNL